MKCQLIKMNANLQRKGFPEKEDQIQLISLITLKLCIYNVHVNIILSIRNPLLKTILLGKQALNQTFLHIIHVILWKIIKQ